MRRTILITGASRGIGKATAKLFQHKDWNVIATMRDPTMGKELADLDNVLVTRLDVEHVGSIASAVKDGIARFRRIDVLVNNAGYGSMGILEATPIEKIRRQFDVNVIGLLETTKAVIPHFRAHQDGIVINVSSVGGRVASPLSVLYSGSKFAVEGISESLAYEMDAIGVRVKVVEPGVTKTDMAQALDFSNDESLAEYRELIRKIAVAYTYMSRNASEPEFVAEVIYKAATDGTDRLRYVAGYEAEKFLADLKASNDGALFQRIKGQFGL